MPNFLHFRLVGRDGDEVLRDRGFVLGARQEPLARRARVGHRFLRREGLRRDREERRRRVQRSRSVSARCAPSTFDTKCVRGPSCVYGVSACVTIAGPEIRSADADVDDVGDAQAGVAEPRAAAHRLGERAHVIERGAHVGHHVAAVDDHRPVRIDCAARRACTARFSVKLIGSPANI